MSQMAGGGEGSLARAGAERYPAARRTAKKGAAVGAATGPHGSSKGSSASSAKRKAAKDPASGRTPRPRATGKNLKAKEEAAAMVAAAAAAAAAGKQKNRLSKEDIRWILSQKPRAPPARFAELKRGNPELIPRPDEEADEDKRRLYRLAKAFYEAQESLPRRQERVRRELEEKGCVELDDETVRRRAEAQAVVDREWPEIEAMMKALILSEKEYRGGEGGGDDSDSDEGEDEEYGGRDDEDGGSDEADCED